jgi:uncharacterized protein YwqG
MTSIPYPGLPTGNTASDAEHLIAAAVPTRLSELNGLVRQCIRLWPKPASPVPTASRFGGLPAVPPGWRWPKGESQPLVFLAQIDCAAIPRIDALSWLPASGLLVFFGDHEEIDGCGPSGFNRVEYFPDPAVLKPASQPQGGDDPLIACGLDYFSTVELPDPFSNAVAALKFTEEERLAYYDLYGALALCGLPEDREFDISKLGGWPDLVQSELGGSNGARGWPLLLQLGWYHDGSHRESWGPGSRIYFSMKQADIDTRRFGRAEIEVQGT